MHKHEFEAGVGRQDLSPAQPLLLKPTGMGRPYPTRGNLDPLFVDALAFRVGDELAIVITADLRYWPYEWVPGVRTKIAEQTGCPENRILFSSTHCHSSSPIAADDSPQARTAENEANIWIREGTVLACVQAVASLAPAEVAGSRAKLKEPVAENRRIRMSDGTCINGWGSGAPIPPGRKVAGPAGPDATEAFLLAVRHLGKSTPFALLVSYDTHPHLYELPLFSAEFPGAAKRAIAAQLPGCTVLYAAGTAGDIDIHCTHPMPDSADEQITWYIESLKMLGERFSRSIVPSIPRNGYHRPESLAHTIDSTEAEDVGQRTRLTINALALGDTVVVSLPGEIFIELGNRIRSASPFKHSVVIAYNGSGGQYCPPDELFEQGSYEVMRGPDFSRTAHAERIHGDEMARRIIQVLNDLHGAASGFSPS